MSFASVNGVKLHYRIDRAASADAPWLVFSNSLGADLSMWAAQIGALSARFNVLRYDTRGHGQSDTPAGPYTIDQQRWPRKFGQSGKWNARGLSQR